MIEAGGEYAVPAVQHCHLEPIHSFAYEENGKIVVVSSTQIPHIVRRVVGQALGVPWGRIRVVKPYIGGGFGNKQDVLVEPLAAWLAVKLHGHPVKVELTREEVFTCTRVRHPFTWQAHRLVLPDGTLVGRRYRAWSNQGGYASHGYAIAANAANMFKQAYQDRRVLDSESWTVYTNCTAAGAMRAYGIPQGGFVTEALTDDLARAIGMDPLEFRLKNCMPEGDVDPHTGIPCLSYGLKACMERGAEAFGWKESVRLTKTRPAISAAVWGWRCSFIKQAYTRFRLKRRLAAWCSIRMDRYSFKWVQPKSDRGRTPYSPKWPPPQPGFPRTKSTLYSRRTRISAPLTRAHTHRGKAVKKTGEALRKKILEYAS